MGSMGTMPVCFEEVVRGFSEEVPFAGCAGANLTGTGHREAGLDPSNQRESGRQSC